ncbi:MAG TPA: TatD family deoxyribonuclease, partial [Armatimonadetes bacterium]|nr:TatD family deoxyribonuclease [Armatimonadota bacterium]
MPPAAPSHWCDAHCHLHDIPPHDGFAALADARAAGLAVLVHCGTQPANWPLGARLATADSAVVPCFGLHPYWAAAPGPWLDELRAALLAQPSAVGEIGLDRTRHGAPWPQQEAAFAAQLALAAELERPAMIHAVRTWQPLLTHLDAHRPPRFLLHAYNGSAELVPQLLARGAWFSFAGATLRPERARAHAALRAVPADRLLAESD